MCIENEKVFNCVRVPFAVFLISLSTFAEIGVYWLLSKQPFMVFPVLAIGLFLTLLILRNNSLFKRLSTFLYLGFQVI